MPPPPRRAVPCIGTFQSLLFAWAAAFLGTAFSQELQPLPRPARIDSLLRADSLARADSLRARGEGDQAAEEADSVSGGKDTVAYEARRIRFRNDRFSLADGALLKYKGSTLTADSIVYYQGDHLVEAIGAPLIEDRDNPPILGYRMRYNLKRKVGTVYYGSSRRDNQTFNGMEVRRQGNGAIYIARGDFSTCEEKPDPHYYFYARRMIVEPNAKVLSGPVVMNIAEVPIAVLPMMVMPLGKGRRSGFLQPKFGGDQSQGFYMNNLGYYWAISDYMDFLAAAELIEGEQGTFDRTNASMTYRYNKRYLLNGSMGGKWYISEFDPSTAGWQVDFAHDQNLTPDKKQTLKGSGRFVSAPNLIDRNALTEEERVRQTANANLGYRRQFDWRQASLNIDLQQENNLTDNLLDRSVPNATFSVGGPLFPLPEGAAPEEGETWWRKLNFNYGNGFNVNQVSKPDRGATPGDTNVYVGYRDNVSLNGKYGLGSFINLTPAVSASQLWSLHSKTGTGPKDFEVAWDPAEGEYGDYFGAWNTSLTADTRLYGLWIPSDPFLGSLVGLRHTLAPSVGFTYAPEIDTNTHFRANPRLGGALFQEEQRTVNLALGQDLDAKFASGDSAGAKPKPYKLGGLNSRLDYNFAREERPWSDLSSNLTVYLTPNIPFTLNFVHGLYDDFAGESEKNSLTAPMLKSYGFSWRKTIEAGGDFSTGVRKIDTQGFPTGEFETQPWSASLNYNFNYGAERVGSRADQGPVAAFFGTSEVYRATKTHSASASLNISPTAGWKMSYDTQYDFSTGRFERHNFAFERVLHCWRMDFSWIPTGVSEGWHFTIRIIDLPDVKLETADSRQRRFGS